MSDNDSGHREQPPAIRLGGNNNRISNVHIKGSPVGIENTGQNNHFENVTFDGVATPWVTSQNSSGAISGSVVKNDPKLSRQSTGAKFGWRRPHGPPLPVLCSECHAIFPSQNYVLAGAFWNLWNNVEQCIACGNPNAQLSEGLFDLTRDIAELLSGPDISQELLKALGAISGATLRGDISLAEGVQKASLAAPFLSKYWPAVEKFGKVTGYLIMLAIAVASYRNDVSSKSDELLEKILRKLPELSTQSASSGQIDLEGIKDEVSAKRGDATRPPDV